MQPIQLYNHLLIRCMTLYHWILGVGLPVMIAVNVAAWPGSTLRSSAGTWTKGGAEKTISLLVGQANSY